MEGIENLKKAVLSAASIINEYDSAAEDGKISAMEGIQIGMVVMTSIGGVLNGIKDIPKEVLDIDSDEEAILVESFKKTLEIRSERTEKIIELAYGIIVKLASAFAELKALQKPNEGDVAEG